MRLRAAHPPPPRTQIRLPAPARRRAAPHKATRPGGKARLLPGRHQSFPLGDADQPRNHPDTETGGLLLRSLSFFKFSISSLTCLTFCKRERGQARLPPEGHCHRCAYCSRGRRAQRPRPAGICRPCGRCSVGKRTGAPAPALPPARLLRPRPILRLPPLLFTERQRFKPRGVAKKITKRGGKQINK